MEDLDAVVVDPDDPACSSDEIAVNRVPTKPLLKHGRIEIDIDDGEDLAAFFEMMARILRERRRVVVTVE